LKLWKGIPNSKVNLNTKSCDCKVWDISGIPYKHAIRCILRDRQDLESYVDEAYSVEKYNAAYGVIMQPTFDPMFWEDRACPSIGPPQVQVKRCRPQFERGRDINEGRKRSTRSSILKCSVCKQYGHNSRSYRNC